MRSIEPDTIPVAAILKILMPEVKLVTFRSERASYRFAVLYCTLFDVMNFMELAEIPIICFGFILLSHKLT